MRRIIRAHERIQRASFRCIRRAEPIARNLAIPFRAAKYLITKTAGILKSTCRYISKRRRRIYRVIPLAGRMIWKVGRSIKNIPRKTARAVKHAFKRRKQARKPDDASSPSKKKYVTMQEIQEKIQMQINKKQKQTYLGEELDNPPNPRPLIPPMYYYESPHPTDRGFTYRCHPSVYFKWCTKYIEDLLIDISGLGQEYSQTVAAAILETGLIKRKDIPHEDIIYAILSVSSSISEPCKIEQSITPSKYAELVLSNITALCGKELNNKIQPIENKPAPSPAKAVPRPSIKERIKNNTGLDERDVFIAKMNSTEMSPTRKILYFLQQLHLSRMSKKAEADSAKNDLPALRKKSKRLCSLALAQSAANSSSLESLNSIQSSESNEKVKHAFTQANLQKIHRDSRNKILKERTIPAISKQCQKKFAKSLKKALKRNNALKVA
ncbi:hypothetical protein NEPAR07_2308 [Nematocida parisii]|nr:hypothetical protein NEPAR07_2308 [Nematocida parisii]